MFSALKAVIAVGLTACPVVLGAGPIGIVKAGGDFRVAGASVRGNGTVFSGDTIESDNLRASVVVNGGRELMLAPHSRSKIFSEKAILESGGGELRTVAPYAVEAGVFRVSTESGRTVVGYTPQDGKLRVTSAEGYTDVRNSQGMLIARVRPGLTLAFQTQAGASGAVQYTGTLQSVDGKYILTDDTTGKVVELRGDQANLAKSVGKKVTVRGSEIPGAQAAAGAASAVSVTAVTVATAAATGTAVSTGVIVGVVANGAMAGVLGGMAATDSGFFGGNASQ